jgi:hypothetical protein
MKFYFQCENEIAFLFIEPVVAINLQVRGATQKFPKFECRSLTT